MTGDVCFRVQSRHLMASNFCTAANTIGEITAEQRKSWLFAGSERGADRAAAMATLIMTAKFNDVDPLTWLADVLGRIAGIPQKRLHELLPWEWKCAASNLAAAQTAWTNYHAGLNDIDGLRDLLAWNWRAERERAKVAA